MIGFLERAITFWGPVLVFAGIVAWRPVILGWILVIGFLVGFGLLLLFPVFSSIRPAAAHELRNPPMWSWCRRPHGKWVCVPCVDQTCSERRP